VYALTEKIIHDTSVAEVAVKVHRAKWMQQVNFELAARARANDGQAQADP